MWYLQNGISIKLRMPKCHGSGTLSKTEVTELSWIRIQQEMKITESEIKLKDYKIF